MVNARDRASAPCASHIKVISMDLFGLIEGIGIGA
jgi:hypothetical protein